MCGIGLGCVKTRWHEKSVEWIFLGVAHWVMKIAKLIPDRFG
jgi:hypothetical protein